VCDTISASLLTLAMMNRETVLMSDREAWVNTTHDWFADVDVAHLICSYFDLKKSVRVELI